MARMGKYIYCERIKGLMFLSSLLGTAGAQTCRQILHGNRKFIYCEKKFKDLNFLSSLMGTAGA